MKKSASWFANACPYEETHHRCEVKECEECTFLTEFCRNPEGRPARRFKTSADFIVVSSDQEENQLAKEH
jgi:hypothetical protein